MLSGYRTYIMAFFGAVTVAAYGLGWIDADTASVLLGLEGFGGLAALRAGVKKGK